MKPNPIMARVEADLRALQTLLSRLSKPGKAPTSHAPPHKPPPAVGRPAPGVQFHHVPAAGGSRNQGWNDRFRTDPTASRGFWNGQPVDAGARKVQTPEQGMPQGSPQSKPEVWGQLPENAAPAPATVQDKLVQKLADQMRDMRAAQAKVVQSLEKKMQAMQAAQQKLVKGLEKKIQQMRMGEAAKAKAKELSQQARADAEHAKTAKAKHAVAEKMKQWRLTAKVREFMESLQHTKLPGVAGLIHSLENKIHDFLSKQTGASQTTQGTHIEGSIGPKNPLTVAPLDPVKASIPAPASAKSQPATAPTQAKPKPSAHSQESDLAPEKLIRSIQTVLNDLSTSLQKLFSNFSARKLE